MLLRVLDGPDTRAGADVKDGLNVVRDWREIEGTVEGQTPDVVLQIWSRVNTGFVKRGKESTKSVGFDLREA